MEEKNLEFEEMASARPFNHTSNKYYSGQSIKSNQIVIEFPTLEYRQQIFNMTEGAKNFDFKEIDADFIERSFEDIYWLLAKLKKYEKYCDFAHIISTIIRLRSLGNEKPEEYCKRIGKNGIFEMMFTYIDEDKHDLFCDGIRDHVFGDKKRMCVNYVNNVVGREILKHESKSIALYHKF